MDTFKKTIFIFILIINTSNLYAQETKKILILNSWSPDHLWVKGEIRGIKDALSKKYKNIEFSTEYMDYPRQKGINAEKYLASFHQFFHTKYQANKNHFDLIFVTDDPALNYMTKYHHTYFPKIPVIFCGINNYKAKELENQKDFYGILEMIDFEGTLNIAKKLHPKAKKFYFLLDKSETAQNQLKEVKKLSSKYSEEFVILDNYTFDELSLKLKNISKNDIVFYLTFYSDITGKQLTQHEIINFLGDNIKVPIFSFWKWMIEEDNVFGGKVLSSYEHGKSAVAKFFEEDINKRKEIDGGENPYIFDYNQLEKFNIEKSNLPLGSKILNKPFSFYETYKVLVIGTSIFIIVLFVFLITLLLNIKKRKTSEKNLYDAREELKIFNTQLEKKVKDRTKEIEKRNEELKQTQNQLIESEKMASLGGLVAGVAHEINTPIGICLTAVTHFIDSTKSISDSYHNESMSEEVFEGYLKQSNEISSILHSNINKTAELVKSFKQIAVDQTSEEKRLFYVDEYLHEITASLKSLIKEYGVTLNIACDEKIKLFSFAGSFSQIITNLIINSTSHAFSKNHENKIDISVFLNQSNLDIYYKDNGKGIKEDIQKKIFDPFFTTNRQNGGTGLGLNIVHNIMANTFKGTIKCESVLNQGTTFILSIPFKEHTISVENN